MPLLLWVYLPQFGLKMSYHCKSKPAWQAKAFLYVMCIFVSVWSLCYLFLQCYELSMASSSNAEATWETQVLKKIVHILTGPWRWPALGYRWASAAVVLEVRPAPLAPVGSCWQLFQLIRHVGSGVAKAKKSHRTHKRLVSLVIDPTDIQILSQQRGRLELGIRKPSSEVSERYHNSFYIRRLSAFPFFCHQIRTTASCSW